MGSLLNFRCPDDLWEAVEAIGKKRHPGGNHHRSNRDYDLTATMLDIVRAGITTLENDPNLLNKTEHKTIDKTEIESMVKEALASELQKSMTFTNESDFATKKDLTELEETLLSLIEEKQTTPTKEKLNSDSPDSYTQNTVATTEPIEVKEGELKSYEESVSYIIDLHRQKTAQNKIVKMLNDGNYSTKSGSGKWTQSMVSGVITSREVKLTAKN